MSEYLQTALVGLWIAGVFWALVFFVGAGATGFLLPPEWQRYRWLLAPIVGWCLLVLGLLTLNTVVGVQLGVYLVVAAAAVANGLALRARRGGPKGEPEESLLPIFLGLGLVALALLPHVAQRSLSLLASNGDEEVYYPAAAYLLSHSALGESRGVAASFLHEARVRIWGFQYTLAAVSALGQVLPFHAYVTTIYSLLGLTVPAWYLFFREVFRLGRRGASLATLFYVLLGLPLWLASHGYGPQIASVVAIPSGIAAFLAAVRWGGRRRIALAGLIVAAGMVAYYQGIAIHYLLTFVPMVALALAQQRRWAPLLRAMGVAAVALAVGLPSHWPVFQWYFLRGAILAVQDIKGNWGGGWGLPTFAPPGVALGTEAFQLVRDVEATGPLAFLQGGLGTFAAPVTWLLLAVAGIGLLRAAGRDLQVIPVLLGLAAYMALSRMMDFQYGYLKLMAVAGPVAYGLVVLVAEDGWKDAARLKPPAGAGEVRLRGPHPAEPGSAKSSCADFAPASRRFQWRGGGGGVLAARLPIAAFLLIAALFLSYNTYEALWFNARGWGVSLPNRVASALHRMGSLVEPDSKVFIAGRFSFPAPPDRVLLRKNHPLAMQTEDELQLTWARRVRGMAATELMHADVYGRFDSLDYWQGYRKLLDDESYDYYLLGPENDPRLEGLDAGDAVWTDSGLALYRSRGVVRRTPWTLLRERGSLAIGSANPLSLQLSAQGIGTGATSGQASATPGRGRLRVGLLALGKRTALVQMGDDLTHQLALEPGITWYTTPELPLPSGVVVRTAGEEGIGVVSLRLLGLGSEEQELVPERVVRDDVYASSSVLPLKHWLTDPFQGKPPGSL